MVEQSVRLILASSSPDRRALLEQAGYRIEIMPSHIDEPKGNGVSDIREFVQRVAWLKANAVASQIDAGILIAADTVAWIDGAVIGKPADEADARRILRQLGGREHELWTGVTLWRRPDNLQVIWQEVTRVFFRPMSNDELEAYLKTRRWENNSGAYAIEGPDDPFVKVVQGSLSNVIGLPMESLAKLLPRIADAPLIG
jgi:septum formation protein